MKNALFLITLILITLASCTNNTVTQKDNGEQYMGVIMDEVNKHNKYWVDNGYEGDTMSFVSIDSVIKIENCAIFNYDKDTSKVKITNHATAILVLVTVKMYSKGYYSKETVVFHLNDSNPKQVWMQTPEMDYNNNTTKPFDLNKILSNYHRDENVALQEYKVGIQKINESKTN